MSNETLRLIELIEIAKKVEFYYTEPTEISQVFKSNATVAQAKPIELDNSKLYY